jgi:site-specific DNA-methyltransferase (cytosine-N4-specific)
MLTDTGDLIIDPFAGSCVTGEAAEKLDRRWICIELVEEYIKGGLIRFSNYKRVEKKLKTGPDYTHYKIYHPGVLWNGLNDSPLSKDGGKYRKPIKFKKDR